MRPWRFVAGSLCLMTVLALSGGLIGPEGSPWAPDDAESGGPSSSLAAAGGACPSLDADDRQGHLTTKNHPATPAASSTNYGLLAEQAEARGAVNGVDAYVFDLGCEVQDTSACLQHREDDLSDPDLTVTFRDASFQVLGDEADPVEGGSSMCQGDDLPGPGQAVPDGTRYLEVTAEAIGSGNSDVHTGSQPTWAAFTLVLA